MMIMITGRETLRPNPTVQVPQWDDPTDRMLSPLSVFSKKNVGEYDDVPSLIQLETYSSLSDEFRMYEFKVRRCGRGRSHDWTDCLYSHPGEKARRRDPRKFHYSGNPCPELRKQGTCKRGDMCEFAHGVFECWLHPSRYRTRPCKDGVQCRRQICFFAHTPDQLRILPADESYDHHHGSPVRFSFGSSPTSTLYCSPPMSPISELTSYLRNLQIGNNGSSWISMSPISSSPRSPSSSTPRPVYTSSSLPFTPIRTSINAFDQGYCCTNQMEEEEEPMMERVESGKELRAKIYAKLRRDNSV